VKEKMKVDSHFTMKEIVVELVTVVVPIEVTDEDKAMAVKVKAMVKDVAVMMDI
jgi:hypothetical protein